MGILSSLFFIVSLVLAVTLGPQTKSWTWGPALISLAAAVLCGIPSQWKWTYRKGDNWLLVVGAAATGWFCMRAWSSPVREFAVADLLLLASAVASYFTTIGITGNERSEKVFVSGLAILLGANLFILALQVFDPTFSPIYAKRPGDYPSGFYGHYNEGANFLIGASFLLAGMAVFGNFYRYWKACLGLLSVAGLIGVHFTHSRGGLLGVLVGTAVFTFIVLLSGKQRNERWFKPLIIISPLIAISATILFYQGWDATQIFRYQSNADAVWDNPIRLFLLGIAVSCVSVHPIFGGGSRSFSWECFRFWDSQEHGGSTALPEMVHNELMQAATDYGIVGASLVIIVLLTVLLLAIIRSLDSSSQNNSTGDAACAGGLAGLAGMLVQSSFSFVFHLLPGAILLGICLARASRPNCAITRKISYFHAGIATTIIVAGAALMIPYGILGTRLTQIFWPHSMGKIAATDLENRVRTLNSAIEILPQATFYLDRGLITQELSETQNNSFISKELQHQAIEDYRETLLLHPYNATAAINLANLLHFAEDEADAEITYLMVLELQGGMETNFRGHFYYGSFLVNKGQRLLKEENAHEAINVFKCAVKQIAQIERKMPWIMPYPDLLQLRVNTFDGLGQSMEMAGQYAEAKNVYHQLLKIPTGERRQFRVPIVLGKEAKAAWEARNPARALSLFLQAVKEMEQIGANREMSEQQKNDHLVYWKNCIQFLTNARIIPEPLIDH